jgi:hypothetical protein
MRAFAQANVAGARATRVEPSNQTCSADVFAVARIAGTSAAARNPFRGTQLITLPQRREFAPTLDLYAGQSHRVRSLYDDAMETAVYLWGLATHERLSGDQLLRRVLAVSQERSSDEAHRLREFFGNFIFILDDRRQRQITFVSDVLGLRPWFSGSRNGQLVAGSNVLSICGAGFSKGRVDYDAVSCWLKYNFDVTGGSVVQDFKNIAPGTVTTYDATGEILNRVEYGKLEFADRFAPREEMADLIHDAAKRSFLIQTRDLTEVNLPLSGGFDSRFLFALAVQHGTPMRAVTMQTREYEVAIAKQVAAAMDHPLQLVRGRRRILDLFDEPFAFNSAGFPTGRNLTNALAGKFPEMPLVSGFMGDGVMRGPLGPAGAEYWAKDRQNLSSDALVDVVHHTFTMHGHRFHLLREPVARNIDYRARQCVHALVQQGQSAGKPLLYCDLYSRHRLYFANIFLQHLGIAEAITPYHAWDVINLRTSYDQMRCFGWNNYLDIFPRHFPQLAQIGHTAAFIPNDKNKRIRPTTPASRHLRRFAAEIAATLVLTDCLDGAKRKRILSLVPDALLGQPRFQEEIQFIYKLQLFERALRRSGIAFDWNAI